jgi:thioredoxin reductase
VNVFTPQPGCTFVEYCREHGEDLSEPIAISLFAKYGLWAQRRLVPELESCLVTGIEMRDGAFEVALETGERVLARTVVMATGLTHWERVPPVFDGIGDDMVSHTSRHHDLAEFRGMDVAVIGGGEAALEAATLLHERGARPRLLVRGAPPAFAYPPTGSRSLKERLLYRPSRLGPGKLNFILDRAPAAAHHLLSDERRVRMTRTHLGPLGAWWLRSRFEGNVPVQAGCEVVDAAPSGSRLRLGLRRADGAREEIHVDHVICGTGYEVDVDRHEILDPTVRSRVRRIHRAPRLTRHFETSVPGLYFVGNGAAFSFGPLFRFVAGAYYTAPTLARHLARNTRARKVTVAAVTPPQPRPAGATRRSM